MRKPIRRSARRRGSYGDRLRMDGVKFFADGALGSRGAWLKQPYADKPDTRGLQFHTDAEYRPGDAGRGARLPDRDPCDRRCRQRAGHRTYGSSRGSTASDRRWRIEHARSSIRRTSRGSAGRDHRLDAADPPDQRPADGREAAGPEPARRRLCLAVDARRPAPGSRSAPTFRSNRPTRSRALQPRSAVRTSTASRRAAGFRRNA